MAGALTGGPAPIETPQVGGITPAPAAADSPTQQAQAPQAAPQISHEQAVATLRHLSATARELETFLQDPDLGKSDMRSKFIDGTTRLVADRYISAPQSIVLLSSVPDNPQLQRAWVKQHFAQNMMAMNAVLDHHAQSNPGTADSTVELARSRSTAEDHQHHMKNVIGLYRKT